MVISEMLDFIFPSRKIKKDQVELSIERQRVTLDSNLRELEDLRLTLNGEDKWMLRAEKIEGCMKERIKKIEECVKERITESVKECLEENDDD